MQRQPTKKSISSRGRSKSRNDSMQEMPVEDPITQMQVKLLKKNEQLTQLKEEVIDLQVHWQEDKRNWQNEKCQLERQIDIYKENIHAERLNSQKLQIQLDKQQQHHHAKSDTNVLEKMSTQLNQEIEALQRELQQLRQFNHQLENKLLSKEENLQTASLRIQKLKKKLEAQVQLNLEEKMLEADKQKKRSNEIRERTQELEIKLKALSHDAERIRKDNRYLQQENDQLRVQYEKQNRILPTLEDQNKRIVNELTEYEDQVDKSNKVIRELGNQLANEKQANVNLQEELRGRTLQMQQVEHLLSEETKELEKERRQSAYLKEEVGQHKQLLDKIEKQTSMMTEAQHKDFDVLEAKVDKLSKELKKLRDENALLKQTLHSCKKEISEYECTLDGHNRTIRDLKGKNKILIEQHDQLDARINELVLAKQQQQSKRPRYKQLESQIKKQISRLESLSSDSDSSMSD